MNILVIGDNCLDKYVYGTVSRISPEAPVPVLEKNRVEFKPGMAAYVKENLKALGASVRFLAPTEVCTKTRYIDLKTNYQLLRVDEDYSTPQTKLNLTKLKQFDAVVISDYNKGFVTVETINEIKNNYSGPVFLDTKKKNLKDFPGVYVKINLKEKTEAHSLPNENFLIVTMGSRGACYKDQIFPTISNEVFDVTGAGDMFLAALAYKYVETKSIEKSITFANRCSSIVIQHQGCYVLTNEDIKLL